MAFSIAVNSDHTLTFDSNTLAWQNEAGVLVTVTLDAAVTALAVGTLCYIDFLLPDGTPYFKGSYDGSGGTILVTLGATDTILEQDGRIGIQFVIRDVAPPLSTEIWKSELKFAKIKSSANATSHALTPVIPPLTFPATFPAEDVSITDAGGYYAGTDVETALQEIGAGLSAFDKIAFDTTAAIEPAYGEIAWDDTDGTVAIGLKNSNVKLQVGQENVIFAVNKHGSNIANGEVVYVSGSTGDRVEIKKANANAFSAFGGTIGIATEPITSNQTGYITTFGLVRDINTSAFAEGAQLFLGTTDGTLTATKPDFPNGQVSIGWCVRSHATEGIIFVSIQHYKLDQAFHQKNLIMNGGFQVNQRGTSSAISDVTIVRVHDRWYDLVDKNSGTLPTLTRSLVTDVTIDGHLSNVSRLTTNGAGTSLGVNSYHTFVEKIEHGTRLYGGASKKVTITFWAKSSIANKKIGISLVQNYGTTGSPTAEESINGTNWTLTSAWTKYTYTFTLNTLVGKTFGTDNNDFIGIKFWYMWGTTTGVNVGATTAETYIGSGTIDIAMVTLTQGDIPMTYVAERYEDVLRQCKRYYQIQGFHAHAPTTSILGIFNTYPVEMRGTPTTINIKSNADGSGTTNLLNIIGVGTLDVTGGVPTDFTKISSGYINKASAFATSNFYVGSFLLDAEL